jgi:drug/metabolite transporter (DMT)-like permease
VSDVRKPQALAGGSASLSSYLALAAAGSFWGLGFVFGKYALADMPVAAVVRFRLAIASAVLVPFFFWRHIRIAPADVPIFAIAGLLFVPVQFLVQFEGLARTSLTHASLMVAAHACCGSVRRCSSLLS